MVENEGAASNDYLSLKVLIWMIICGAVLGLLIVSCILCFSRRSPSRIRRVQRQQVKVENRDDRRVTKIGPDLSHERLKLPPPGSFSSYFEAPSKGSVDSSISTNDLQEARESAASFCKEKNSKSNVGSFFEETSVDQQKGIMERAEPETKLSIAHSL